MYIFPSLSRCANVLHSFLHVPLARGASASMRMYSIGLSPNRRCLSLHCTYAADKEPTVRADKELDAADAANQRNRQQMRMAQQEMRTTTHCYRITKQWQQAETK